MMQMKAKVMADCHRDNRGYQGAELMLPAGPHEIEDAIQRAHVPEGDGFVTILSLGRLRFMKDHQALSGRRPLEEASLLVDLFGRMDEIEAGTFEGAVMLCQKEKGNVPVTLKEMINLAYNLDSFEFCPGILSERDLGRACLDARMLDLVEELPDGAEELLDLSKVGKKRMEADKGILTEKGYIFRGTETFQEIYDGERLPVCGESRQGLLSLRIEKLDATGEDSGVWLELLADEKALHWALISMGEDSFDACRIAETKSAVMLFQYQLAGDEDIWKLNTLAGRLQDLQQEMPDGLMLMKYKAVLELEQHPGLDMELDIAANLDCYDYSPDVLSPDAYGEYVLQRAGIDTGDPAFSHFDFRGYGERQLEQAGYVFTPYGAVSRNGQAFVHEYTRQGQGMEMK